MAKHTSDEVLTVLDRARQLKVLVVGETIIDDYQYCETLGKTGKEPVLAAQYVSGERFPGGILAVANHTASVAGNMAPMLTLLGQIDSEEDFVGAPEPSLKRSSFIGKRTDHREAAVFGMVSIFRNCSRYTRWEAWTNWDLSLPVSVAN